MTKDIDFDFFMKNLSDGVCTLQCLDELALFFKRQGDRKEYAIVREHEFYINGDIKKLRGIGNLYLKMDNKPSAYRIFMLEGNKEKAEKLDVDEKIVLSTDTVIEAIADRYMIYTVILGWFCKNKDYDAVRKYVVYDKNFSRNEFVRYLFSNNLSEIDDFDMNMLAVEYNNTNMKAWFNIFDKLCEKNEPESALNLYNELFLPVSGQNKKIENICDLYWRISNMAFMNFDYYKQVLYQGKAVGYE